MASTAPLSRSVASTSLSNLTATASETVAMALPQVNATKGPIYGTISLSSPDGSIAKRFEDCIEVQTMTRMDVLRYGSAVFGRSPSKYGDIKVHVNVTGIPSAAGDTPTCEVCNMLFTASHTYFIVYVNTLSCMQLKGSQNIRDLMLAVDATQVTQPNDILIDISSHMR